jgi:two-component system chemotaxis sensor kinase CheA
MEDFRQHFSTESIKKLSNIEANLRNVETLSEPERRELFRTLHTIKGSSQTFGLTSASRLAHKLESLLSFKSEDVSVNQITKNLFVEGIELLIKSLQEKHFKIPASFTEKINAFLPVSVEKNNSSETLLPKTPVEISSQLSGQEKNTLDSALIDGKNIYGLEVGFDLANFAVDFKKLREILSESNEIIATLPSPKFKTLGKIGFQLIFASSLQTEQIYKIAERNTAEIILDTSETVFSNDLQGILAQVVEHGKTLAKEFGKQIDFEVSADEIKLSAQKLKLIFDVLLHLTRNAVDHAIESAGKVKINLKALENGFNLSVSDDGRGINLEKVKAKAVEKNLISAHKKLNEQEILDLIFLPEFSTASALTEISGRGIGLDAVKDAVETANGKINVKSQNGKGTTFEIFLHEDE